MIKKLLLSWSIILLLFFGVLSCQLSEDIQNENITNDTVVHLKFSDQSQAGEDSTKSILHPYVKINKPSNNAKFYPDSLPCKVAYDFDAHVDYGGEFSAYLDGNRFFYYKRTEPPYAYYCVGAYGDLDITSNGKHTLKVKAQHTIFGVTLTTTKSVDFYINPPGINVSVSSVYPNPVGTGSALKQNFSISLKNTSSLKVVHRVYNELGNLEASTTRTFSNISDGTYKWVIWNVPHGKTPGIYFTNTTLESGSAKITTDTKKFIVIYVC